MKNYRSADGLMFPKPVNKKKRKRHKQSILHCKDGTCYLCIKLNDDRQIHRTVHEHHVYDGPNRGISEAEGFKVYLCPDHHMFSTQAVHTNIDNMRLLQQECQRVYEQTHTRKEFMALIGRNFLDEHIPAEKAETENDGFWMLEE